MIADIGPTNHLHIEFKVLPIQNMEATRKEGRPIYDDVEHVEIKFVGDPKKVLVAPAHEKFTRDRQTGQWVSYAEAYHKHYEAFQSGQAIKGSGTPIDKLPFLTEGKCAELRALNIHTAEALAGLEGANLSKLGMYGRSLKNQAAEYISHAKETALETRLQAENDDLKARLAALEAAMNTPAPAPAVEYTPNTHVRLMDEWTEAELKGFIKEQTGSAPRGQPARETLIAMAKKAHQDSLEAA